MTERPGLFGSYRQAAVFMVSLALATVLTLAVVSWVGLKIAAFADALIDGRAFPPLHHAEPTR